MAGGGRPLGMGASMRNRAVLLATVSSLVLAGAVTSAAAADLPVGQPVMKAPPIVEAPFTWTGFYIGIQGGYGWADHEQTTVSNSLPLGFCTTFNLTDSCTFDASGGVFGGF